MTMTLIICKEATTRFATADSSTFIDQCRVYQDYNFDYSDDGEGEEAESADIENMYYTAKCAHIFPRRLRILISMNSEEGR